MAELGFWKLAQDNPSRFALAAPDGREWTRGELFSEVNRIGHGLRALGLGRGDCVAMVMQNCAEVFEVHLAITQLGMYLTPINHHLTGPEIAYIIQDSGAKAFIGSERFSAACTEAATATVTTSPRKKTSPGRRSSVAGRPGSGDRLRRGPGRQSGHPRVDA